MKSIVIFLFLTLILCTSISCKDRTNKESEIISSEQISGHKLPVEKVKYNLIDESMSLEELRTQVLQTENIFERMQIFDYLLNEDYVYGQNVLAEHYKHGVSEGPRMILLQEAVRQNDYLRIKEWCLYKMIQYEEKAGRIESALAYADSLRNSFSDNKLLDQRDYYKLETVVSEVERIMADSSLDDPARLFQLGKAYMGIRYLFWKRCPGDWSLAYKYFDELLEKYPESPYVVNATFTMTEHEYGIATEGMVDSSCGVTIADKYAALLRRFPETTIRDEVLLRITVIYLCKTRLALDMYLDSARYYLLKADSCFNLVASIPQEKDLLRRFTGAKKTIEEYHTVLGEP